MKSLIRGGVPVEIEKWILCPVCGGKTRSKIRKDTLLLNYPLYCPKCKQETLINVRELHITLIKEPDALTLRQSARFPAFFLFLCLFRRVKHIICGGSADYQHRSNHRRASNRFPVKQRHQQRI